MPGPVVHPLKALAAETVSPEEFDALLARAQAGERPRAYIGFEPSGTAHVGWMVCAKTVQEMVAAGFDVTILLADWHAYINDKLGGDLKAIRRCADYMVDVFESLGIGRDTVTYRFAEEFAADKDYWELVIRVAKSTTLARIRRAMDILGRSEDEADKDVSKFLYPAMQVADIFHLGVDLAYGGLDQRHAHMLARDVAKKLGRTPPVALHTALVPNLKGGAGRMDPLEAAPRPELSGHGQPSKAATAFEAKMSKSDPSSGIFLHDTAGEVEEKMRKAHCPARETDDNPVLDLVRLVIVPRLAGLHDDGPPRFEIKRPAKFGGNKIYLGYEALEAEFKSGALHPMDLKSGAAAALNRLLGPVRAYFAKRPDDLDFVQGLKRTR